MLITLIAMIFTNEVNWTLSDFVIAGIILFSASILIEFVYRKSYKFKYRIPIILIILIVFMLIWAELAVGIFGTAFSGS